MNDSGTARTGTGRREEGADVCAQMRRLARANARLRVGVVGVGMLIVGFGLGGFAAGKDDSVVAYTATDDTIYRVYESGRIEYLRVEDDPPRTVEGVFGWGKMRVDDRYELQDRP